MGPLLGGLRSLCFRDASVLVCLQDWRCSLCKGASEGCCSPKPGPARAARDVFASSTSLLWLSCKLSVNDPVGSSWLADNGERSRPPRTRGGRERGFLQMPAGSSGFPVSGPTCTSVLAHPTSGWLGDNDHGLACFNSPEKLPPWRFRRRRWWDSLLHCRRSPATRSVSRSKAATQRGTGDRHAAPSALSIEPLDSGLRGSFHPKCHRLSLPSHPSACHPDPKRLKHSPTRTIHSRHLSPAKSLCSILHFCRSRVPPWAAVLPPPRYHGKRTSLVTIRQHFTCLDFLSDRGQNLHSVVARVLDCRC